MEIAVVVIAVVLVVVLVVVLARQGSPARLSEEDGRRRRQDDVTERPAGPGAESMGTDQPGRPTPPPNDPDERAW